MAEVYAYRDGKGEGYRLRTEDGETGLGSMGEVDACLSVINATAIRTYGSKGWEISTPFPCNLGEVALYNSKIDEIRADRNKKIAAEVTAQVNAKLDAILAAQQKG